MHEKRLPLAVLATFVLLFTGVFFRTLHQDASLILNRNLPWYDETSNAVVAANITRQPFPPMVRLNPLVEEQGHWFEGPHWQHIPPLFAYIPPVFYILDGEISIEGHRLSYGIVLWITGILFLAAVYLFSRKIPPVIAAGLAAILWIRTPFTRSLITGHAFGVSDIVAATVTAAFAGMLWYLFSDTEGRRRYALVKLIAIALLCALPLMAKNLLGAIPAATYFSLLLWDHRKNPGSIVLPLVGFFGALASYYVPLYAASPAVFRTEIMMPFLHFTDLEGWGRPWHFFLTSHLPNSFLFQYIWLYYLGLFLAIMEAVCGKGERKTRVLYLLPLGWFVWNLAAVSFVQSKSPNFIFQAYLLSLFAILFPLVSFAARIVPGIAGQKLLRVCMVPCLIFGMLFTARESLAFARDWERFRSNPSMYGTESSMFSQTADELLAMGVGLDDIVIPLIGNNDCWFRYYMIFLTGAESVTVAELREGDFADDIAEKYTRMHIVFPKGDPVHEALSLPAAQLTHFTLASGDVAGLKYEGIRRVLLELFRSYEARTARSGEPFDASCKWGRPDLP